LITYNRNTVIFYLGTSTGGIETNLENDVDRSETPDLFGNDSLENLEKDSDHNPINDYNSSIETERKNC